MEKEIEWTNQYGSSMEPDFPHNAMGLVMKQPGGYIELLKSFQSFAPHFLPQDTSHAFNRPILRHPDPTLGNIYMDPETGHITCLIDWQHAIVQPRLLASGYPRTFENSDDELPSDLELPQLPEDLESQPVSEQHMLRDLRRRRTAFQCYLCFNGAYNRSHLDALRDPLLFGRQILVDRASRLWAGNFVTLKCAIVRTVQHFQHLPDVQGTDCPVQLTGTELKDFTDTEEKWLKLSVLLAGWHERVGMTEEDWVRNEDYYRAKKELEELKEEIWKECEGDIKDEEWFRVAWPFRDREEIY